METFAPARLIEDPSLLGVLFKKVEPTVELVGLLRDYFDCTGNYEKFLDWIFNEDVRMAGSFKYIYDLLMKFRNSLSTL